MYNFSNNRYKINGLNGWGVSEWEYRHRGGKPIIEPEE